jgi:hypothetical protein
LFHDVPHGGSYGIRDCHESKTLSLTHCKVIAEAVPQRIPKSRRAKPPGEAFGFFNSLASTNKFVIK